MKKILLCYQEPILKNIEVIIESGFVGSMEQPVEGGDIDW